MILPIRFAFGVAAARAEPHDVQHGGGEHQNDRADAHGEHGGGALDALPHRPREYGLRRVTGEAGKARRQPEGHHRAGEKEDRNAGGDDESGRGLRQGSRDFFDLVQQVGAIRMQRVSRRPRQLFGEAHPDEHREQRSQKGRRDDARVRIAEGERQPGDVGQPPE